MTSKSKASAQAFKLQRRKQAAIKGAQPMRDLKYRKWLRTERCVVGNYQCVGISVQFMPLVIGPCCDPVHTENNGMRSKGPDSSCVPLCRIHHQAYDAGRAAFEKKYSLDLKAIAAKCYAEYQTWKAAQA